MIESDHRIDPKAANLLGRGDVQLVADVEALLQELDETEFDDDVGECALL